MKLIYIYIFLAYCSQSFIYIYIYIYRQFIQHLSCQSKCDRRNNPIYKLLSSSNFFILLCGALIFSANNSILVERSIYIVHMDNTHMPKVLGNHHHWHSSIIDSFILQSLQTLYHQMTINPHLCFYILIIMYFFFSWFQCYIYYLKMNWSQILKKSEGFVLASFIVMTLFHLLITLISLNSSPQLHAPTGLWPTTNYEKDVFIGVIDSGIWSESPSFKDDGMNTTAAPTKWKLDHANCQSEQDFNSTSYNCLTNKYCKVCRILTLSGTFKACKLCL